MARVFVAVWPPPHVVERLAALPRPDLPGLRWVPAGDLHVTLRFLGDAPVGVVAERVRAAAPPRATARVGPATAPLGARILMAPVAGLDDLAAAVAAATADLGRPARHPFRGHVTLARARDRAMVQRAAGVAVTARFEVTDVAVVTSETRPEGARYTTAATIPCPPGRSHR